MLFLCRISCKTPADMTSKRDHERDAELDKKIEALRRKNEALMKRYKVRTIREMRTSIQEANVYFFSSSAEVGPHTSYSTTLCYVIISINW